jgi:hypothetical protein
MSLHPESDSTRKARPAGDQEQEPPASVVPVIPKKFFISYRRSEKDSARLADLLAQRLSSAGHETFIDIRMRAGTDWVTEIGERIAWCDYLIVLLSAGTHDSEMVQGEVRSAHLRHKREHKPDIIPIRLAYAGTLGYELDSYLSRLQYVMWNSEKDDEGIVASILDCSVSGKTSTTVRPSPVTPPPPVQPEPLRPQVRIDPRLFMAPGGSIPPADPFYVERPADVSIRTMAGQEFAQTLLIKGPRQMGKSSMLIRFLKQCRENGKRACLLNLGVFADELDEGPALLKRFAEQIARTFKVAGPAAALSSVTDFTRYIEDELLAVTTDQLVIAFDEADRVLGESYATAFFISLRGWHDSRASENGWDRVTLALVISTEPNLLITTANFSPFNVAVPMEIAGFSREACATLNERYGSPLDDQQTDSLFLLLGGHPYLTRLAFYQIVICKMKFDELYESAGNTDGPFGEHLHSLLYRLKDHPEILKALKMQMAGGTALDPDMYYRLHAAGIVRRVEGNIVPSNLAYEQYLRRNL